MELVSDACWQEQIEMERGGGPHHLLPRHSGVGQHVTSRRQPRPHEYSPAMIIKAASLEPISESATIENRCCDRSNLLAKLKRWLGIDSTHLLPKPKNTLWARLMPVRPLHVVLQLGIDLQLLPRKDLV